jgi:hypothetical protein
MEYWAVVLAGTVLLLVALAGGALTLVRTRRVGGSAAALAGTACGVLVLAAVLHMVWYTRLIPGAIRDGDPERAADLYDYGVLVTFFLIAIGVGLLVAATNIGRPAAAPHPAHAAAAAPAGPIAQPARPAQHARHVEQAQPAQGWTPPQQPQQSQQPQPDWNIHSGVWSIPRGTFDGPPPDQRQR